MDEARVHISGFRMDFGDTTVVRDLSFDVRAGETFGSLGSNGPGKTTTVRALLASTSPPPASSTSTAGSSNPSTATTWATFPKSAGSTRRKRSSTS